MKYNFEKFDGKRATEGHTPYITIFHYGNVAFKGSFLSKYVNGKDYVTFYFDRGSRTIGMAFHTKKTASAYKVVKAKSNPDYGAVCCPSFLKSFKILPPKTYHCKVKGYNKAHGLVIVRLKDKIEADKPRREVERYHVPEDQPQGKGFMVDKMLKAD